MLASNVSEMPKSTQDRLKSISDENLKRYFNASLAAYKMSISVDLAPLSSIESESK